jgi:GGDEF domain-containing protein
VRPGDSVARIGGDEFAVLLPETDAEGAAPLVDELDARHSRRGAALPRHGRRARRRHLLRGALEVVDAALYTCKLGRAAA